MVIKQEPSIIRGKLSRMSMDKTNVTEKMVLLSKDFFNVKNIYA